MNASSDPSFDRDDLKQQHALMELELGRPLHPKRAFDFFRSGKRVRSGYSEAHTPAHPVSLDAKLYHSKSLSFEWTPEDEAVLCENLREIRTAIEKLSPAHRAVLRAVMLVDGERFKILDSIMEETGYSRQSARQMLYFMRARLKELLGREITCEG